MELDQKDAVAAGVERTWPLQLLSYIRSGRLHGTGPDVLSHAEIEERQLVRLAICLAYLPDMIADRVQAAVVALAAPPAGPAALGLRLTPLKAAGRVVVIQHAL